MKLLILAVSVIAVFTADSREVPGEPNGGDPVDNYPGSPEENHSAERYQPIPEKIIDLTSDVDSQIIPDKQSSNQFADSAQNFDEEPVFQTSEFEEQRFLDGPESNTEEPQLPNSLEEDHQQMEEGNGPNERALRDSQCKENVICGLLGGACMANTTVCSGWLVSEGCQGTTCKCCIPGSLEIKMKNFGLELQSMKDDLTKSSLQQTTELKAMIENITNTNAGLKGQIQSFTDSKINATSNFESQLNNLTQTNLILQKKLDSIEADVSKKGCPEGLFWFSPSEQCFKYLTSQVNWATANSQCKAQGLELAKPYDPVALRVYMAARYTYTDWIWLGAKGDGSGAQWQRDGQKIISTSYLWYSNGGTKSTSYCLALAAHPSNLKSYYNNPYHMDTCTTTNAVLCEYVHK